MFTLRIKVVPYRFNQHISKDAAFTLKANVVSVFVTLFTVSLSFVQQTGADKLMPSMQTTGGSSNLIATKATARIFPVDQHASFKLAAASNQLPTSPGIHTYSQQVNSQQVSQPTVTRGSLTSLLRLHAFRLAVSCIFLQLLTVGEEKPSGC